ncbi:MAG: hypothetical protein OER90_08175 [Gemmatimonadota bacterium]|nr:hypothetical protein [Gemmatimonadota bacterium]
MKVEDTAAGWQGGRAVARMPGVLPLLPPLLLLPRGGGVVGWQHDRASGRI